MRTLRDLTRQKGLSILLSTHDLDLALRCADKLWLFGKDNSIVEGIPESLALDGSIAAVFASESLDWDAEHGSFRMHRNPCASVWIEGEGTELAWTRRALARIGYGLADSQEDSRFIVKILGSPKDLEWLVTNRDLSRRFNSIESLVTWMQNPNYGKSNHPDPHYPPFK
jgi:iron complex transport system ATP-binding protein